MNSIPTVHDFMNGDFSEMLCPVCGCDACLIDWSIRYAGQGAGQHCLLEGEWCCEGCGELLSGDIEIRWGWMIDGREKTTMIYPSNDMEAEYRMLVERGFYAATWAEVLAFELERTPHMQEAFYETA